MDEADEVAVTHGAFPGQAPPEALATHDVFPSDLLEHVEV